MNIKIRALQKEDIKNIAKHANNPKIAKWLNDGFPCPYTENDAQFFIKSTIKDEPNKVFAIDVDGQAVGSIGISLQSGVYRKNAEMGYWLSEEYWGKGITLEAIKQMIEYSFDNFDIIRIFARPFGTNIQSQRVLEKAGFKLEARFEKSLYKNGEYLDDLVYAYRK